MVIEKVTGKSISDNFEGRLLNPLKMTETSVPGTSTDLPDHSCRASASRPIRSEPSRTPPTGTRRFAFTAGEVISTLDDLHKWGVALGTGEGILPAETQQMRVESVNTTVPQHPAAVLWHGHRQHRGWLGHTGEIPGYNTVVNYQPQSRTTIVIMVNSDITNGPATQPIAPR